MSKSEAKETKEAPAPADKAGAAPAAGAATAAPAAGGSALKTWLPAIVGVVLAPVICFAVAQFVLLPKMQKQLAAAPAPGEEHAAEHAEEKAEEHAATEEKGGHGGKEGKEGGGRSDGSYEFTNVVVNLAGTMGTRYLKTSFIVIPGDKKTNLQSVFDGQKAKLTDVTLNVLSSLTLADLEEPGSKNVLREKLVATYNQALGKHMVDQVYFSDFVVQ